MDARPGRAPLSVLQGPTVRHVVILLLVSIGFESLFIHHGINPMDEGWPLHAAMELHGGRILYEEVFWVFPPGHLLPAWIAYALDPPGIVLARIFYAAFCVALCIGIYFLSRKLMAARYALFAGLLVAVAAPTSHLGQLLFGYRYLIFSVIALLFFHRRLTSDDSRWMALAGLFAGFALYFRLTPAAAVSVGIGIASISASRDWRRWFEDGFWYVAGLAVVLVPVLLYFNHSIGLERFWIEVFVRPVEMTDVQSKPIPMLHLWGWGRKGITAFWFAVGIRLYAVLYAGFAGVLFYQWMRSLRGARSFDKSFLLAVVLWGGVYFGRSFGRTDVPHLDSAIPPVMILIAYLVSRTEGLALFRSEPGSRKRLISPTFVLCASIFALWSFFDATDTYLGPNSRRGTVPVKHVGDRISTKRLNTGQTLAKRIPMIQQLASPDDTILVMTAAPLIYVVSDRHSPGGLDFVMPGTFRSDEEEIEFLARLEASPPAVVVWPELHFDLSKSRGVEATAPRLYRWIKDNYRPASGRRWVQLWTPKGSPASKGPPTGRRPPASEGPPASGNPPANRGRPGAGAGAR